MGYGPSRLMVYTASRWTSSITTLRPSHAPGPSESVDDATKLVDQASAEGFSFHRVSLNDVTTHISPRRLRGEDGIPQTVIAKALVNIFNFEVWHGRFSEHLEESVVGSP